LKSLGVKSKLYFPLKNDHDTVIEIGSKEDRPESLVVDLGVVEIL
jgi:hypothetical protein